MSLSGARWESEAIGRRRWADHERSPGERLPQWVQSRE